MDRVFQLVQTVPVINRFMTSVVEKWHSDELKDALQLAHTAIIRLIQFTIGASVLLSVSSLIYAILYYIIMPSRMYQQPLYFNYGPHSAVSHEYVFQPKQLPSTHLNFLSNHLQWQASDLIDAGSNYADRVLAPGTYYDIIIELEVPESDVNNAIGMFMINTTLSSKSGTLLLAKSARPAIVKRSHWLQRAMSMAICALPSAIGWSDFTQIVSVTAFNGYYDSSEYPATGASVMISHPQLQLYSAKFYIIAQLHGIRYLMYHWFVPTAILAILNIAWMLAIGFLVVYASHHISNQEEYPMNPSADFVKPPRIPEGMVPISPQRPQVANSSSPYEIEEKSMEPEEISSGLRYRPSGVATAFEGEEKSI